MQQRLTTQQRAAVGARLRVRYERELLTVAALAEVEGRSFGWVHQVLADAGTVFRPRGGGSHASKLPKAGA